MGPPEGPSSPPLPRWALANNDEPPPPPVPPPGYAGRPQSRQGSQAAPPSGSSAEFCIAAGKADARVRSAGCCGGKHGRIFAPKKPSAPTGRRPNTCGGATARARQFRFTQPTPVRRVVAAPPQPLGCAALSDLDESFGRKPWQFTVPNLEARKAAVGGMGGTPFLLQRVLRFTEAWFEPISEPRLHDWLGKHRELMQNYQAFRSAWEDQRDFIGPSAERHCIHLLALGPEEPSPVIMQALQEACAAFFSPMRVAVIRGGRPDGQKAQGRRSLGGTFTNGFRAQPSSPSSPRSETQLPHLPPQRQGEKPDRPRPLVSEDILSWLSSGLRSDSALTVALTLSPLTHNGKSTCGASDWSRRVGVFSLAETLTDEPMSALLVERTVKFLLHQVMHMLGVLHCCYFRCLMNGAAHQEEADGRPPYLCGMCLKKLHLVIGMDPLLRYMHLAHFWAWAGNPQIALWYETRVRVVRSTFSSAPVAVAQLPPPSRHTKPQKKEKKALTLPEDLDPLKAGEDDINADDALAATEDRNLLEDMALHQMDEVSEPHDDDEELNDVFGALD